MDIWVWAKTFKICFKISSHFFEFAWLSNIYKYEMYAKITFFQIMIIMNYNNLFLLGYKCACLIVFSSSFFTLNYLAGRVSRFSLHVCSISSFHKRTFLIYLLHYCWYKFFKELCNQKGHSLHCSLILLLPMRPSSHLFPPDASCII